MKHLIFSNVALLAFGYWFNLGDKGEWLRSPEERDGKLEM